MKFKRFENKIWLSSPTMHGEEEMYVKRAFEQNWITTAGENVDETERISAEYVGVNHAVALSCGTAALHMAVRLAGERLYGKPDAGQKALEGRKVFCSDMTFAATVNPVIYEGGRPVYIDTEYDTWNMDPVALEKAFDIYPDVRMVVFVNLYGTPAKIDEIRDICLKRGALLIEDAAESLGAEYRGKMTGCFGDYSIISFNGNKIITGSSGGVLLTDDAGEADKARKWSTQSREEALWYQHEELGYNYRMSNIIAGIVRGQYRYIEKHIAEKKRIYDKYSKGFQDLPVQMNPYDETDSEPNFWLSCMLIRKDAMCKQVRGEKEALYISEEGKSCPAQILETLAKYNAEGRPLWKPMHMQPVYRMSPFITRYGNGRAVTNAYAQGTAFGADGNPFDIGMDIFTRGLCLPSDIKMTEQQQDRVIEIVKSCFE